MGSNLGEEIQKELSGVKSAFTETTSEFKKLIDQQNEEIKRNGVTTSETAVKLAETEKRYDEILAELKGKTEEFEGKMEEFKTYVDSVEEKSKKLAGVGREFKTIDQILNSEDGKHFLSWDPDKGQVASPILRVKNFSKLVHRQEAKAITDAADIRAVLGTTLIQTIKGAPILRSHHVRDHMTVIQLADVAKVDFVRETSITNNADFQDGDGAGKPLSDYVYDKDTATAATIAHGTPISRQLARHAPVIMSRIEERLIQGLYNKEDLAILFADGNSGAYTGITETTGVQNFADHANAYSTDDTYGDTIRRAFTMIQAAEMGMPLQPNMVVVNPYDAETIDLTKDAEKRYLNIPVVGPDGMPVIWRLPMFVTTAMTQGSFLLGDFRSGATLYETDSATVQMFTQHADYAIKNMVLLLAEMEEILTVDIPSAFVSGTFAEGS